MRSGRMADSDYDGTAFAERTGWINPNDGVLVRNVNGTGTDELYGGDGNASYRQTGADGQAQEHLIADVQLAVNFSLTDANPNHPLGWIEPANDSAWKCPA